MEQVQRAAKMAGGWWAQRLIDASNEERNEFAAAVARLVEKAMAGEIRWVYGEGQVEGFGEPVTCLYTQVDYDPKDLLLDAVREVINPSCRGFMFSADGILPRKHELKIEPHQLTLKEGYGNWTKVIEVPA